jgi:citrate synthase
MCAGAGGAPAAAALTAALAVGAGGAGGAREVLRAMQAWQACGKDVEAWRRYWTEPALRSEKAPSIWPVAEHPAGFDPLGVSTPTPVEQLLAKLAALAPASSSAWLLANLSGLELALGQPLSLVGVAAAAFVDLELQPEQGEMLFLLLRLPGAAAHALEQRDGGHKHFPFYELEMSSEGAVT